MTELSERRRIDKQLKLIFNDIFICIELNMHLSSNAIEVDMNRRVICIDQISIFVKEKR